MSIRLQIFAGLLFMMCLISCHSSDKRRHASAQEILGGQLFAGLTDSIGRFPQQPDLYLLRAYRLSQQNLHELAAADYKKAWQLRPDESTALAYASSLFLAGDEESAMQLLQQSAKAYPSNPEFLRRLSEAYVQRGELNKALDQYNELLKTDSANFDAWYQKGVLLAKIRDTLAAIHSIEKAYSLQPIQLYGISLADLYAETNNSKAIPVCNNLIGPDSAQRATDALYIKGIYYGNTRQWNQALQQYDACIRKDWKYTEAYIEKGIILFNEQNIDEALNTFAIAAKVSVTYPDAYYWMGRCYEKIGKHTEARESYERAIALDGDYREAEEALQKMNK